MSTTTRAPARRRWLGLTLIATAQFIVIMDTSIIGVALPRMQAELGFTPESLSWVFNAYVVAFGGLLLLGGRLSDLLGARRVFISGWLILAAGSVLAGAAGTVGIEILGRAVQGAGAALIAPAALSLLVALFGGTKELPRAFAVYGAAAPIGGTAGVFLGGVLTEYASWPWVFYITVPIAALVILLTPVALPVVARQRGSVDVIGAITGTVGLAALVYGVVRAPEVGWATAETLIAVGVGAVLLAVFFIVQARSRQPLLRLGIFRTPQLGAANLAQLLLGAAWVPMWFFLNLYLQQVLGAGAFAAGAALLPMTVLIVLGMTLVAPRLLARFGAKPLIVAGFTFLAAGLVWLSFARPDGMYAVDVLPASLVAAFGMALAFVPSLGTAIGAARPEETGVASGLVNTSYQIGSAVGLAALTVLSSAVTATGTSATDLTGGYAAALKGAALVAALGAILAMATLGRRQRAGTPDAERETVDA
ncbi:MFS transporter [Agromyces ramosus]|uniref:EmrB/QacA subfamily drug resistance transporter n=1 Tax=Agromyces ramosus TaxID=33879 RepID=A0ABU0R8H8_9MICO|nr:MFS transporter [Agromyces ramosus]MDQ0893349.1 EmrB/QacA subfamily drug resistance transporter [Agromyces ramosus]